MTAMESEESDEEMNHILAAQAGCQASTVTSCCYAAATQLSTSATLLYVVCPLGMERTTMLTAVLPRKLVVACCGLLSQLQVAAMI